VQGRCKSVVQELEKCKIDLVGVQEVRWEIKTADNYKDISYVT
jgi:hypothetical protein